MRQEHLAEITRLRHTLHRHPELSMQESETMQLLQTFLRQNTSLEVCPRDGWFYARKAGTASGAGSVSGADSISGTYTVSSADAGHSPAGRTAPIAFRADMDALPIPETICLPYGSQNEGVSHKCGHDGHCAALCGLALELSARETARDIYLIFQPGEEIGAGGQRCAELIREKKISEIYAFHNLGGYPEGTVVYRRGLTQPASEGLRIRLTGKTSHASAPEKGKNPAGALAAIVQFALHSSGKLCTITGIRLGDGDFGISPGEGEICMTLRAGIEEEMKALEKAILAFAAQKASADGLLLSHSIHDYFPETRNHDGCLDQVLQAARANQIPSLPMPELWRASEDFGHYLKVCPGAMFYIGNGENYPALHTVEYDFNDKILERAVDLFLQLAAVTE